MPENLKMLQIGEAVLRQTARPMLAENHIKYWKAKPIEQNCHELHLELQHR